MKHTRENWIDNIKIFACVLVTLGHFFQSMCISGFLEAGAAFQWFNRTVYYFHVPLFFICSGYLYQRYSVVNSAAAWRANAVRKLAALGIPYFVFSLITWGLKRFFSGAINIEAHGLGYDLFVHPMPPYWYLYALFFIFLITPTFSGRRACAIGITVSAALKCLAGMVDSYAVTIVLGNQLWFVLGMVACVYDFPAAAKKRAPLGAAAAAGFFVLSFAAPGGAKESEYFGFLMGILACTAVMLIFRGLGNSPSALAAYTMPVFLMHTIFAAGLRSVLLKLGITATAIHIAAGLAVSFLGPVIAAEIMRRTKLDFFLYPGKYLRGKK